VPTAIFESALTVMLLPALRDIVRQVQPQAVVTTYPLYQAPLVALNTLSRRPVPVLTVVTDLATVHRIWFNEYVDACLVPTQTVQLLAVEAGVPRDRVEITGLPVNPQIAADARPPADVRRALGWRTDLTTVLAVGSKRVSGMVDVLRALNHSALPLQLVAVAGGDDATYEQLQGMDWHAAAHVYNFVRNMPDLMRAADCVVCKAGGLIVTESLARGLPLILIDVIPGQETGNAEYVVQGGAGALASTPVGALETLFDWLQDGGRLLAERAEKAKRLGRPRAAFDVADRAWQAAVRGPAVEPARLDAERVKLRDLLKAFDVSWE
jgi:UDP-N-acetylglucosamine:LPS N-acetylglucosamine transferase